jgi:outer membrane protein assembly factor BamA
MKRFVSASFIPLLISVCAAAQGQPQVTIGHIAIIDTPGISEHELNQIAKEVEGNSCTTKDAAECIGERVRDQFQQRGYFKAAVLEPRLKPSISAGTVDANVVVEPGAQYHLANLEFRFSDQPVLSKDDLAPLVTMRPGMLFDTGEVRRTLENLRKHYVARGYSKVAVVPQTVVNDEKKEITLSLTVQPEG